MENDHQAGAIETRQQHLIAVLRGIRNVNQLIITEENPKRLIERVCTTLAEEMGYFNVWICLVGGEAGRSLGLVDQGAIAACASAGFGDEFGALRARLESGAYPACMQRALETGNTLVTAHPATDCPDCPLSGAYHDRAGLTQRLAHGGMIFGILAASVPAGYAQDSEEQDLFRELANDLAFALHRLANARRLQESEARLALLGDMLDRAPAAITVHDTDGNFFFSNNENLRLHGYDSEQEFVGIRLPDLDVPASAALIEERMRIIAEQGEACFEVMHRRKDGTEFPLEVLAKQIVWAGRPALLSIATDITERKQTEEAIQAANQQLQAANQQLTATNQQLRATEQQLRALNQQLVATNRELKNKEAQYRGVFEASKDMLLISDLDGVIKEVNPAACDGYGYSRDEIIGMTGKELVHPDYQHLFADYVEKTKIGELFACEAVDIRKDGSSFDSEVRGSFFQYMGQPHLLAIVRDITERKKAEDRLIRSQNMLARTEHIANIGSWEWDVATDTVTWSEELFRIMKMDPAQGAPSFAEHPRLYHPEDMQTLREAVEDAVERGTPYELELRAVLADETMRTCLARGQVETDDAGRVVRLVGSLQDVTERKQAEENLVAANQQLRATEQQLRAANQELSLHRDHLAEIVDERTEELQASRARLFEETSATAAIINEVLDDEADDAETERQTLNACLAATSSKFGMIGVVNEDGKYSTTTYNSDSLDACAFPAARAQELTTGMTIRGIWGWPMLHGEPLICNNLEDHPDRVGQPEGHVPIESYLGVPIKDGTKATGMVAVANKPGGYTSTDQETLGRLVAIMTISRQYRRATQALRESESKHSEAQRVARLGHWELAAYDGTPIWSDEVFRIFGLEPGEMAPSFTAHDTIIHPDDWPLLDRAVRAGFEEGVSFDFVFKILRPSGEIGWMHAIGKAETDAQGNTIGMFGTAQDITELKLAQREVAERERLLSTITTNMFDVVSLTDLEARCTYASPSHRQLGHEPADLLGRPVFEFVHEEDRAEILSVIAEGVQALETRRALYRFRRGDGSYAWLESIGKVLTDDHGEPTGMIFSTRDMTAYKNMQSQIAQADRLSSMGMLAAGVAHEINNPLSYVLYNLESLTEDLPKLIRTVRDLQQQLEAPDTGKPSTRSAELAQAANPAMLEDILARFEDALGGAHRIRDIARGLGTFSRVEKDQAVPVNLMHVIEVAINMAYNEIKYRARLVKDYGRIPTVLASEGRLSQVFLNLIINATHAIDEGDVENNEIRVKTWVEDEMVCAEVRDTGSGIAPENVEKLFEPFFTTKKLGMGSGLGLAISKNIIESYGGSISVQSELGESTTFVVLLPIRVEQADTAAEEAAKTDEDRSIHGRILIVDDEAGIRSAMARMLREHEIVQAASGAEAKRLLQHDQDFDLILCDMMMPDLSGMDLHRWLLETSPALAKQLIFITGGAFTPRAREYLSKVDNIRLEKPFDVANFKKIVNDRLIIAKGHTSR